MRRWDWLESRSRTMIRGSGGGAGSNGSGAGPSTKRLNSSESSPLSPSASRLPTAKAAPREGDQRRPRKATMPSRVKVSRMCSGGPRTGRPRG